MRQKLMIPRRQMGDAWRFASGGPRLRPGHTHVELEINLVLTGTARYLVREQRVDLSPGMMIWLFPEQDHLLIDESPDYTMWIGVFRPSLLRRLCRLPENRPLLLEDPSAIQARQIGHLGREHLHRAFAELAPARENIDYFNACLGYLLLGLAGSPTGGATPRPSAAKCIRSWSAPRGSCGTTPTPATSKLTLGPQVRAERLPAQPALPPVKTDLRLADYRNRQRIARFVALYGEGRRYTLLEAAARRRFR